MTKIHFRFRRWGGLIVLLLMLGDARAQPAPLAGLDLIDHRQQRVTAEMLGGAPVLMNFVFTGCTAACPLQLHELVDLRAALPPDVRNRVRFVSVTVDPLNDTPQSLAAFATRMQANQPGWRFVTGKPDDLTRLASRMAVFDRGSPSQAAQAATATPAPADHRTWLWLYDARGALVQRYVGMPVDKPRLIEELSHIARQPVPPLHRKL